MARNSHTPMGAVVRGLFAGAAGTAAMTAYQTAVMKARDAEPSSVPAEVGKRIASGVFRRRVPPESEDLLNNAMHWAYGTGWGAAYGVARASTGRGPALLKGPLFGALVWGASLVELPAMKLAPPVWEYPPAELGLDVSYHLVYGVGTAVAFAALSRG